MAEKLVISELSLMQNLPFRTKRSSQVEYMGQFYTINKYAVNGDSSRISLRDQEGVLSTVSTWDVHYVLGDDSVEGDSTELIYERLSLIDRTRMAYRVREEFQGLSYERMLNLISKDSEELLQIIVMFKNLTGFHLKKCKYIVDLWRLGTPITKELLDDADKVVLINKS